MRTLPGLLLVLALVSALPDYIAGQTADSTTAPPDTSRRTPDPRIALILGLVPGGGQLYNRAWLKAVLVVAAEGYFINQFLEAKRLYDEFQPTYPDETNPYLEPRNKFAWQLLFVYIIGLLDGYVDAHLSTFPSDSSDQVQPQSPSNQSIEEGP